MARALMADPLLAQSAIDRLQSAAHDSSSTASPTGNAGSPPSSRPPRLHLTHNQQPGHHHDADADDPSGGPITLAKVWSHHPGERQRLGFTMRRTVRSMLERGHRLANPPVSARHAEWSVISSSDDMSGPPSSELIDLVLRAGSAAASTDLSHVASRSSSNDVGQLINTWPGEHYRFLSALAAVVQPTHIVEVGTYQGAGALSLLSGHPAARLVTYDIVPYDAIPGVMLTRADMCGHLEQRIGDLADTRYYLSQLETLQAAELIFVDGPKDGAFEQDFLPRLLKDLAGLGKIIVLDDIRVLNMVDLWRRLDVVRMDATSLGHWSGTGVIIT